MSTHTVTLTTEELVFVVGALIETHKRYMKEHRRTQERGDISPYYAAIAYMSDAYEKLNPLLPVPRDERLSRTPEDVPRIPSAGGDPN